MYKITTILLIVLGLHFTTQAQITNIIIDSLEYSYFKFPIVYDKVDEFEGTRIMHSSRVDWGRTEAGTIADIWVSKIDDIIVLNILSGFEACVDREKNLRLKLETGEIVELESLNELDCQRLKVKRYLLDDESIKAITKSSVEIVRIATSEGNIDFKPIFKEDKLESSLSHHQKELDGSNLSAWEKKYHREAIQTVKEDYEEGYIGNPYYLVHLTAPNFEGYGCAGSKENYLIKRGEYYGLFDSLFDKYDVDSCKEVVAFYNLNLDILASLILTIQAY